VLITTAKSKRRPFEVQPLKAVTKKSLSEDRFVKALKAVADGKVTVESIVSEFEITIEQLAQLNEIKPK
jgi:predicted Rossmann fold nucleotide-binding protein DprA/Smf involved in DNA uptake